MVFNPRKPPKKPVKVGIKCTFVGVQTIGFLNGLNL